MTLELGGYNWAMMIPLGVDVAWRGVANRIDSNRTEPNPDTTRSALLSRIPGPTSRP